MNKYSEIEIQTAENLLKEGYKWIIRDTSFYGHTIIFALKERPHRNIVTWSVTSECRTVCTDEVPIFQNIRSDDTEPVSLDSIVHPQILDDVERRYLSTVIKPFKNQVRSIVKHYSSINSGKEYLAIITDGCWMMFPEFEASTMYKGMKTNREYTPDELCL